MEALANGCRFSGVKVTPQNWKSTSSTKKDWSVWYRFYDDRLDKKKQVADRSMNWIKDIGQRQDYVRQLIIEMERDLKVYDFNPITEYRKSLEEPERKEYEIDPTSPISEALQQALDKKKCTKDVRKDLRSVLKYTQMALRNLHLDQKPVNEISRRHMLAVMEQLELVKTKHVINKKTGEKGKWTANTYNFYRAHLMILFEVLFDWEVINTNPMEKMSKEKHVVAKRQVHTPAERKKLDELLRKDNYRLWRLMHIFFHSGARETEIMKVRKEDVDLKSQLVTYTILKGRTYKTEQRPIKDICLHLWEQVVIEAKSGQYLFAKGLLPGDEPINSKQMSRRWKKWVKDKYHIEADFYSLKHSNSTETKRLVGARLAAKHNQHTEKVLNSNYDMDAGQLEMEILKSVDNAFA